VSRSIPQVISATVPDYQLSPLQSQKGSESIPRNALSSMTFSATGGIVTRI